MSNRLSILLLSISLIPTTAVLSAADLTQAELQGQYEKSVWPLVQTYCVTCHSGDKPKGDLNLSTYTTMLSVVKGFRQWEIIQNVIAANEMPPESAKAQPTPQQRQQIIDWIKATKHLEANRNAGDPGKVLARRLSNAEYDHTIRDLTGTNIRPTREFPVDPSNESGFDNSGESLAMSPALVNKYLEAAREVASYIVFKPSGFDFGPHIMLTEEDRDKYAVHRIVDFYKAQKLDYADFFQAAWRFQNRAALGKPNATMAQFANELGVSPKYLERVLATLDAKGEEFGPIATIQARWKKIPAPAAGKESEEVRVACEKIRDFIVDLRPYVQRQFANLPARGIADGSQSLVLWKDRAFADNRMTYAGNALELDMTNYTQNDPLMLIPEGNEAQAKYEESFKRFCAVFPDSFYIDKRARMFLTNPREIASDLAGNRYLSAGFHSQMGYFRDDKPLCEMVLSTDEIEKLDQLWQELDFITHAPFRQHRQFVWFERAEPPSYMYSPEFNSIRSEDDDILSETKIKQLSELYLAKAKRIGVNETAQEVVAGHFVWINQQIRTLEKSLADAEPKHLDSLLDFAKRAYRRPLTDGERQDILGFYRSLRDQKLAHEDAVRDTVVSILMSPKFCYRMDLPTETTQPLSNYELASRLSYFLWASMPDEQLLARAAAGDLNQPQVLIAQARRMLKDPRVRGLATEFGGNWLDIRRFEEHNGVDRERFPTFTNDLRSAMFEEPIRYFTDLFQRDGSVMDLVYGDYTFVNPALAKHYGMPEVKDWTRIDNAGQYQRGSLLPMSAFLTKNSPGLRTSPVKRGYWVVKQLLGEHIPAPPPNVPDLPTDESKIELTLPQALAKHRADPSCSGCHEKFDSFGLVFEGFGPVGEWRTRDLGDRPVQNTAAFPDGSEGTGLEGLRKYIRQKREQDFQDNLSRKLLVYSLGRGLAPTDEPLVQEMKTKLTSDGYRFGSLVESIVTSRQFLNKRGTTEMAKESS